MKPRCLWCGDPAFPAPTGETPGLTLCESCARAAQREARFQERKSKRAGKPEEKAEKRPTTDLQWSRPDPVAKTNTRYHGEHSRENR